MTADDSIHGLMLIYVAGAADEDEISRAEALLCGGTPRAVAAYAEASAVYHTLPMALLHVVPPGHCCDKLFGRITSDLSADTAASDPLARAAASTPVPLGPGQMRLADAPSTVVTRLRWPIYITSGLAACLAVALTMAMVNRHSLEGRYTRAASAVAMNQELMRSPQVSLASMETQGKPVSGRSANPADPFGRVLFCHRSGQYQFALFNLPALPDGQVYEVWLITPDKREIPVAAFEPDANGAAIIPATPGQGTQAAAWAAVTVEPAGGSAKRTGTPQLWGTLLTAE